LEQVQYKIASGSGQVLSESGALEASSSCIRCTCATPFTSIDISGMSGYGGLFNDGDGNDEVGGKVVIQ